MPSGKTVTRLRKESEESMLPVTAHYRVSKAREGMSAPMLCEQPINGYCDYRGFNLAHIYADIDHSGYTNSRARPALRELCDHRRKYAAVVGQALEVRPFNVPSH